MIKILSTEEFPNTDVIEMIYKIADYLDIPKLSMYVNSQYYQKLYKKMLGSDEIMYSSLSIGCKVKRYRENRLEEYLVNGLLKNYDGVLKYQIDNMVALVHKILDYDFENRISAEDCKKQLILIETQL